MRLEDFSPELQEKARACKTAEELLGLARAEGIELEDEQLEQVAGGWQDSEHCKTYDPTRHL